MLRHSVKEYEKAFNRKKLHNLLKNHSPIEWLNYLSASLANKICVNQILEDLTIDFLWHSIVGQENTRNNSKVFFVLNTSKSGLKLFVN